VITGPSDFGSGLGGPAGWDNTSWTMSPETMKAYFAANTKATTGQWERRISSELDMRERQTAAYVMANLEGERWSGNAGLRFVRTRVNAHIPMPIPPGTCKRAAPGQPPIPCPQFPGAITDVGEAVSCFDDQTNPKTRFDPSAGLLYYKLDSDRSFNNLLPSLNIRYELSTDMLARFGASKTIGRQNYNLNGAGYGTPGCNDNGCTVTGPNPNLKPMTAKNLDASWSWFFAKRSLVAVDVFYSKIDCYPKTGVGSDTIELLDPKDTQVKTFKVQTSSQQGARIAGLEISYEQPFGSTGFGFTSNVRRAQYRYSRKNSRSWMSAAASII
jgi:iron complex outermembrane receptor protein